MSYPYNTPFNKYLTQTQMEENARYLANLLTQRGWSLNAICAALGNWQSECGLNPNRPQKPKESTDPIYPQNRSVGFGLPQWTPWGLKYGKWCESNGIANIASDDNPAADFTNQLNYHDYECSYGYITGKGEKSVTWINRGGYSYTWSAFKTATDDVAEMAKAYYWQYERSDAQNPGKRPDQAVAWYQFLQGITPDPPDPPSPGWNDYVMIKCDSFEVLNANCYYNITTSDVRNTSNRFSFWQEFFEPSLNLNIAVKNYLEIEFVPINFYYVFVHYTESEWETVTGKFTVTNQIITTQYISKYLKTETDYKLDGIFGETINYGDYQSIKIIGNIGVKNTNLYGTYSGKYNSYTLNHSQNLLGSINCNYEKRRKPWMMALKQRRYY